MFIQEDTTFVEIGFFRVSFPFMKAESEMTVFGAESPSNEALSQFQYSMNFSRMFAVASIGIPISDWERSELIAR